jgi:putrescine aminotransferase
MNLLHPFSKIKNNENTISSAYDYCIVSDNKIYLDGISGLYNCPLGYSVQSIKDKMIEAIQMLPSSHIFSSTISESQTNIYTVKLQELLKNLIPFSRNLFLSNSGSEAIDSALNLCKTHSKSSKSIILSYTNSYHGSTFSGLAASGNLSMSSSNNIFIDFYYFYDKRFPKEYITYVENKILEIGPEKILAFIVEPMIGASGGFFMKENILPLLASLLRKYNIYFILDEAITGFGRMGYIFAWQKYNVIPDVLVLSKAITNGYVPLSCCITSFDFNNEEVIQYGFSTAGHPVSCSAAIESIFLICQAVEGDIINNLGDYILDKIKEYDLDKKFYKIEMEGLFIAFHLSDNINEYTPSPVLNKGGDLALNLRSKGIILRGNSKSLIFSPGYYMSYDQVNHILKTISNEML